jgi:hypothetical protein
MTHQELLAKTRREQIRWFLLVTLNVARPAGCHTHMLLNVIHVTYPDATHQEVRRELDYLEERQLVKIDCDPMDQWFAELTRTGMDVVDYTIDCQPGIARPRMTGV